MLSGKFSVGFLQVMFNDQRVYSFLEIFAGGMPQSLVKCKGLHPKFQGFTGLLDLAEYSLAAEDGTTLSRGVESHGNSGCIMVIPFGIGKAMQGTSDIP